MIYKSNVVEQIGIRAAQQKYRNSYNAKIHFVLALDLSASNYKIKWLVLVQLIEYPRKKLSCNQHRVVYV